MTALATHRVSWKWLVAFATVATLVLVPSAIAYWRRPVDRPAQPALFHPLAWSRPGTDDAALQTLQQQIKAKPNDIVAYISLANAYLQRVRETGDPAFYAKTDALLKQAAKLDPLQPQLLTSEGVLALARHDFAAGLALGKKAEAMDSENPRAYGVVTDGEIEMGQYDEAIKTLQAMIDHRPDFSSYSRVAYARELYGDPEGAIEAMQYAINAGGPVPENTAWGYVQLGNLQFGLGHVDEAGKQYDLAIHARDQYPAALAGQARVATAKGQLEQAATLYGQAFDRMPLPEYAIAHGDVLAKLGRQAEARQQYDLVTVVDKLLTANGVNIDLETALFFADHDLQLPESLARARAAYAARPSVTAADGLAWTLYKTGNMQEAGRYAHEALKLGTRDALKLFHAGMIANALGQTGEARTDLQTALALNPNFSLLYQDLARTTLQGLGPAPASTPRSK